MMWCTLMVVIFLWNYWDIYLFLTTSWWPTSIYCNAPKLTAVFLFFVINILTARCALWFLTSWVLKKGPNQKELCYRYWYCGTTQHIEYCSKFEYVMAIATFHTSTERWKVKAELHPGHVSLRNHLHSHSLLHNNLNFSGLVSNLTAGNVSTVCEIPECTFLNLFADFMPCSSGMRHPLLVALC